MGREKRQTEAVIAKLNADQFVQLVADILSSAFGHSEVKIVDGPGDGRRDIHSATPDGEPHITQCKYHNDISVFLLTP